MEFLQPQIDQGVLRGGPTAGTTGFLEFSNAADGGERGLSWSTPINALADDDSRSQNGPFGAGETNSLQVTELSGVSIPTGATITAVTIRVKKRDEFDQSTVDGRAVLIVEGVLQANDQAKVDTWPASDENVDYEFTTSLPTRTQVLASNFGFAITGDVGYVMDVNSILCKVDYLA